MTEGDQQVGELVGVLFFHRHDLFEHAARGRILVTQVLDEFAVAVDRNALGHQVFPDHPRERVAGDIFRVAAAGKAVRRKVRLASKLHDPRGDQVGVPLLFVRMDEELLGNALRMDASRHEVMAAIAQDTDQFRGQRIVQHLEHGVAIGRVARGDGAFIDAGAGADAHRREVGRVESPAESPSSVGFSLRLPASRLRSLSHPPLRQAKVSSRKS